MLLFTSCREGKFSETRIQEVATLDVRSGAKWLVSETNDDGVSRAERAGVGVRSVYKRDHYESNVNVNPRDFRKAAPYLGAVLLAAIVFLIVRSLL